MRFRLLRELLRAAAEHCALTPVLVQLAESLVRRVAFSSHAHASDAATAISLRRFRGYCPMEAASCGLPIRCYSNPSTLRFVNRGQVASTGNNLKPSSSGSNAITTSASGINSTSCTMSGLPTIMYDKGHYQILPCLSGKTLCERSRDPYRVSLRRASAACGPVSVTRAASFFMTRREGIGRGSLRIAPASHREARIAGARTHSRLTMMGRF